MRIKDLDNQLHNWNLTGNFAKANDINKSQYHLAARKLLVDTYPTLQLLEEVPIPLRRNETLYLDFYLPLKKLCVEVHGEQHYEFCPFFHTNKLQFLLGQKRDNEKKEWCEINGIKYIVFPYNQIENWGALLNE
jgi:hypothetical protein